MKGYNESMCNVCGKNFDKPKAMTSHRRWHFKDFPKIREACIKRNIENNPMKNPKNIEKAVLTRKKNDSYKWTESQKRKLSLSIGGNNHHMFGKHHKKETREKISNTLKATYRSLGKENHPSWRGGISLLYSQYGGDFTKEFKTSIRKRDKFTCAICHKNGFCVHHIDYDKKNNNLQNLITLCRKCHGRTHYNREYWIMLFNRGDSN